MVVVMVGKEFVMFNGGHAMADVDPESVKPSNTDARSYLLEGMKTTGCRALPHLMSSPM